MASLTKFQVYQLIALLDLNGVRAGKGKDPSAYLEAIRDFIGDFSQKGLRESSDILNALVANRHDPSAAE